MVTCLRHASPDGKCPVVEKAPVLFLENETVVEVWRAAEKSAKQVDAEDKTYFYVEPNHVEAVMRLKGVPECDLEMVFDRVLLLQSESNRLRPRRPKKGRTPGNRRRGL